MIWYLLRVNIFDTKVATEKRKLNMTPLKFLFFPKNSTISVVKVIKKKLGKEFTTGKNIFL